MSATTGGAIKTLIEGAGLSISAFRERAPEGTAFPYVSIQEAIDLVVDRGGDNGDGTTCTEVVQVDVWQQKRNPTTQAMTENYTLPGGVIRALHGKTLLTSPTKTYGLRVVGAPRVPDTDSNILHDAITVEVKRVL